MDARIQSHFDALERDKTALMAGLERLSDAQIAFQPAPGAWSMLEVVQVMLGSGGAITRKPMTWRSGFLLSVVLFVLRRVPRVRTVPAAIPRERHTRARVQAEWAESRVKLRALLETLGPDALEEPVFLQPVAGPVTALRGLEFLQVHLEHHRPQLERIRGASGFPTE
jgi:DinB superfamily